MLILYQVILFFYVLLSIPVLLLKGKWHGGFLQRLGIFSVSLHEKLHRPKNIWVHAVSVGEVIAITELLRQLQKQLPEYNLILSTVTKTGYELAVKRLQYCATVIWAPLDFQWVVAKFIRVIQPKAYLVAETELWPSLFNKLSKNKIPMLLINGRISDESYGRYKLIRWIMKKTLNQLDVLCMQSDEDVRRMVYLGVEPAKVRNVGNVKFDDLPDKNVFTLENFGFDPDDLLWIAGSTHPAEEEIVLNIFEKALIRNKKLRLIIAPRHIERAADIVKLVESKGFYSLLLSRMHAGERGSDAVIVVDTIGHLRTLYSLAYFVFIGKSLTVQGGHNVIEPAFFAKPIFVGPHTQNFRDIVDLFKKDQAIVQVQSAQELEDKIFYYLDHPQEMINLGLKAKGVIEQYRGATERSVEILKKALNNT